jgi:hypothetical protein
MLLPARYQYILTMVGRDTYGSFDPQRLNLCPSPFQCGLSFLERTFQFSNPILGAIGLSLVIPNLSSKRLDQFNLNLFGITNLLNLLFPALGFTV